MADVSEHFRGSGFKVFARMLEDPKNQVWAIPGTGGGCGAFCDRMNSGRKGGPARARLHHVARRRRGRRSACQQYRPRAYCGDTQCALGLKEGDAAFFVAGDPEKFWKFAGLARTKLGEELNLVDKERFELAWIVDFPMYEYDEDEKKIDFSHNPFSMPQGGLAGVATGQDPLTIKAFQYDITCNGYEIASGGIRNHRPQAMVKAFEIAGYGEQDGGRAFRRHVPRVPVWRTAAWRHGGRGRPHCDAALRHRHNLREISLFPMNQRAEDLLMGAPSEVAPKQLRELAHPAQSAAKLNSH